MRIDGAWFLADDGVIRPVIRAETRAGDASWQPFPFQVDTGADCTVFSAAALRFLELTPVGGQGQIAGVGGKSAYVVVDAEFRFTKEDGGKVVFRGRFRAATELETLDMSVLGRDITNLFAVIVDRPRDVVCLLGQRHSDTIIES